MHLATARKGTKSLSVLAVAHQALLLAWALPAAGQLPPSCLPPPPARQALAEAVSAELFNAIGGYFTQRNESGCAVAAFQQAFRLGPSSQETRFNLGLALIQKGDLKTAVDHLSEFSQSAPEHFLARMAYGSVLAELGEHEAAARSSLLPEE